MKQILKDPVLILASQSPRRRYLLEQAGLKFTVVHSDIDESSVPLCSPDVYVKILAEAKAKHVSDCYPKSWVIGADTIVMIGGAILGKPSSIQDARNMLERLSGQVHQVFTGFSICCKLRISC